MVHKIKLLLNCLYGYFHKMKVDIGLSKIPSLYEGEISEEIVVSMTSYGRRVSSNIVYYTLISILRQKVKPSRIILWLASNEWNDENLPMKLLSLKKKGVEIMYCADLRSYKKLIPTLELCKDKSILTLDDDVMYSDDLLQRICDVHKKHPNDIICLNSSRPNIVNGIPKNYKNWNDYENETSGILVFPVGVGGTLYPAGSLHSDVMNVELFQKLCPIADDIWFWFCGLRNNTNKQFVHKKKNDTSFDRLYQFTHKGSALTHSNKFEHQNDRQFRDLFAYYNVIIDQYGHLIKNI